MPVTLTLLLLATASSAKSQQLVYTPINPAFGGSPFNASWLLSEAQAQNGFTQGGAAGSSYSPYTRNALEDFKQSLNSQILSQLSRQLISKTFGTSGQIKPGHFEFGDYVIDITESIEGVTILIYDNATGNETSILVPYF
jgi:curli production assembly/transport component CsgF